MGIIKPTEPAFMSAEQAARRNNFGAAARSELALRDALESFCRSRWSDIRICHEMVMGEGKVRADVVAVGLGGIAAFEVKGAYDDTSRLIHQVFHYQLAVPEVWVVVDSAHAEDARLIRYLLPSVGIIVGTGVRTHNAKDFTFAVEVEAAPIVPHTECMLQMLWRAELAGACARTRCYTVGKRTTRKHMIEALLELPHTDLQREVCIELRGRIAQWRADPAIPAPRPKLEPELKGVSDDSGNILAVLPLQCDVRE